MKTAFADVSSASCNGTKKIRRVPIFIWGQLHVVAEETNWVVETREQGA